MPPFALNVTALPMSGPPLHRVPQNADAFDLHFDDVADTEELRWLPREADALRRPGDDHVARFESAPGGELAHETRKLEDHEASARILLRHTVHTCLDAQRRGIKLIRRHDPRPERQMTVKVLSLEPLTAVPSLHISHRDIVGAGVAEHMRHRGCVVDVQTGPADDHRELALPVQL